MNKKERAEWFSRQLENQGFSLDRQAGAKMERLIDEVFRCLGDEDYKIDQKTWARYAKNVQEYARSTEDGMRGLSDEVYMALRQEGMEVEWEEVKEYVSKNAGMASVEDLCTRFLVWKWAITAKGSVDISVE